MSHLNSRKQTDGKQNCKYNEILNSNNPKNAKDSQPMHFTDIRDNKKKVFQQSRHSNSFKKTHGVGGFSHKESEEFDNHSQ